MILVKKIKLIMDRKNDFINTKIKRYYPPKKIKLYKEY